MRIFFGIILVVILGAAITVFGIVPARIDDGMNVVTAHDPYELSGEAEALHETLRVADLHSDMLLWMRDPTRWNDRGHTDLPRLRAGGVALQVFASVTKTPSGQNYDSNTADSDDITALAIVQRWPVRTWTSILERAVYHADRLNRLADRDDSFTVVRTRADLEAVLAARETDPTALAGLLETEGAHPLEGDLGNIDVLWEAGYRMLGLQHFFDNELGGSLHGVSNAGLTDFGRDVIRRMDERGLIIDVAHSSPQVVDEVLAMTNSPLVVSHTGVHGHCEVKRNIPDALMQRIAAGGGLIGIGFWADVTCDDSPEGVAATLLAAIELVGIDHVALGSDYDGTVTTTFDASEYAVLTDRLLDAGLSESEIRQVMGENTIRFFLENLPES
ncbi:dipeptidase [Maricaulis maris]|uniref:Microsomal dipeptidase-like Zn-dependent dipeptidase n=1 Tax=Maricaulis maris TaxID=74318 RepID=A0A495D3I2_9PROT|nr:membrane dipeptidase [Maricaulis maris]RKQ96471.1 microsomal dipeptidase-like Zn-dependent dipeptidase [Maricaulis maris]